MKPGYVISFFFCFILVLLSCDSNQQNLDRITSCRSSETSHLDTIAIGMGRVRNDVPDSFQEFGLPYLFPSRNFHVANYYLAQDNSRTSMTQKSFVESGIVIYHYAFSHWVPEGVDSELKNDVKPIILGYLDGGVALPGYFFNFRYETDFGFRTGEVKTGREARDTFNLSEGASYLLKTAGGINGVELSFLTEHYQFGKSTYTYSQLIDDSYFENSEDIKFESKRRQIDVKYHFGWRTTPEYGGYTDKASGDLYLGYRYANIKTLKIIYTVEHNKGEDPNVIAESKPQLIDTYEHLVGFGICTFPGEEKGFSMHYGFELYVGGGYTKGKLFGLYAEEGYFTDDQIASNKSETMSLISMTMGGTIGAVYNVDIGGADVSLFSRYDPVAYARSSHFEQDHGYTNFFSNDGDIYNKISFGGSLAF